MRKLVAFAALALFAVPGPAMSASSHMTFHQRFEHANTTHDGHLTLDQAKAGMKAVARHFDAIDKDHKGYVTEADIHAYYKAVRAAARARRESPAAPAKS